jgi:hypothetical protein
MTRVSGLFFTILFGSISVPLFAGYGIAAPAAVVGSAEVEQFRGWIQEMKSAPRGPFERIRWFCADGAVLPPQTGCVDSGHGTGVQHGEWSERTKKMRVAGYEIGNLLVALEPPRFTGETAAVDSLGQVLVERFLIEADQGWIFRGAYGYRGAFQAEDEERGAHDLMMAMLADPEWRAPERFLLLRETTRLFPLESDTVTASKVRRLATDIANADKGFEPLRAKIHGKPDAGDSARVRDYADAKGKVSVAPRYADLATQIDDLYAPRSTSEALTHLADSTSDPELTEELREWAAEIMGGAVGATAFTLLLASLAVEREAYAAANVLATSVETASRRQQIEWMLRSSTAGYGIGLLTKRQLVGIQESIFRIAAGRRAVTLGQYRDELRFLARAPGWAGANMEFTFGPAIAKLSALDALARQFAQDRLRGSPLLVYGVAVDSLSEDANRLAEVQQDLFGQPAGGTLRALNAGLVRGVLRTPPASGRLSDFDPKGIYLLPETIADLPPVSGILTQGEGSSLSHVQLLANNLGIPNVVVGDAALGAVRSRVGSPVVLAVSRGGVVRLVDDGKHWDTVFNIMGRIQTQDDVTIRPDLAKLDLTRMDFISLSELRASDSGRLCGPKGANLGELKFLFGERVPNGFVIPFGVFRAFLDRPIEPGGPAVFEWMKEEYRTIADLAEYPGAQGERMRAFLAKLRSWITSTDPGDDFRARLRGALNGTFGPGDGYGVFVRSDTNVEDLPGFTGAGLNLTVPNVVGFDNIVAAVQQVWSSPFTERSYSWRQSHMEQPEYVLPSVVVQLSFPSEKSGVMVTTDLEARQPGWISIAVSEGVGGAVDGQAAEALRVNYSSAESRQLARATSPYRREVAADGGVNEMRASGVDSVLREAEIVQLLALARDVDTRFPGLQRADGSRAPADVEFAFRKSQLALLQIRPFVENKRAREDFYLAALDVGIRDFAAQPVDLDGIPGGQ